MMNKTLCRKVNSLTCRGAVVLALILAGTVSDAQSPTYAETREYIVSMLSYDAMYGFKIGGKKRKVTSEVYFPVHCEMRVDQKLHLEENGWRGGAAYTRVIFKNVDPDAFRARRDDAGTDNVAYKIRLQSSTTATGILTWAGSEKGWRGKEDNGGYADIRFIHSNSDYFAGRVVKALRHMAELCGSKKELF